MESLLDKLNRYLAITSDEEKRRSWDLTAKYAALGPTLEEYEKRVAYYRVYSSAHKPECQFVNTQNIGQKFSSDLFYI